MLDSYIMDMNQEIVEKIRECVRIRSVEDTPIGNMPFGEGVYRALINLVHKMFIDLVMKVNLSMAIWATALLAATRITGSVYQTANLAGQLGIAKCSNMKDFLKSCWIGAAALWIWVILWSFVGPMLIG